MNWHDRTTTKKGDIGERIVREFLVSKGYVPYVPIADIAHPFDNLCASPDKKKIFIVEVKTKEARKYYPDTGINIRNYDEYAFIRKKYGIEVFIYFVDATNKKVYGNRLSVLEEKTTVGNKEYPKREPPIIYFPLCNMQTISELTDEQCTEIRKYTTKNYNGAWAYKED